MAPSSTAWPSVTATDSTSETAMGETSITVIAGPTLAFSAPPSGEVGATYSDTLIAAAHCVGVQWTIIDSGTSEIGCGPPVPPAVSAEIGKGC